MPIVKITVKLNPGMTSLNAGGVRFETGMNVEIADPDSHPKSGKNYFNTSNVKLIVAAFVKKYGTQYSRMGYDFIRERMEATIM